MQDNWTKEDMIENLRAADCDDEMIQQCMDCMQQKEDAVLYTLLRQHRDCLLDSVHQYECCIHCLDYFIYRWKQRKGQE